MRDKKVSRFHGPFLGVQVEQVCQVCRERYSSHPELPKDYACWYWCPAIWLYLPGQIRLKIVGSPWWNAGLYVDLSFIRIPKWEHSRRGVEPNG